MRIITEYYSGFHSKSPLSAGKRLLRGRYL